MSTLDDFFAGSDEGNRAELDARIAALKAEREKKEAQERKFAADIYEMYKNGDILNLKNYQKDLLEKYGYMKVTEASETSSAHREVR